MKTPFDEALDILEINDNQVKKLYDYLDNALVRISDGEKISNVEYERFYYAVTL